MRLTGIVAEYNPFHNGHAYQLREAKRLSGADGVVVALSQEALQRGAFSSFDKSWRTQKALENGADLVVGLPYPVAGQSAEHFARGAVEILKSVGVDSISFGAESKDLSRFMEMAEVLADEPEAFREDLRSELKSGLSFPKARQLALERHLGSPLPELESPNNILALEYVKASLRLNTGFEFYPVERVGKGYHETGVDGIYPSATGIREALKSPETLGALAGSIPYDVSELAREFRAFDNDRFFTVIKCKLMETSPERLAEIEGISGDLANRLLSNAPMSFSLEEFHSRVKSKNFTQAAINRAMMNLLFGFTKKSMRLYHSKDYIPYIRVLGFNNTGRKILRNLEAPRLALPGKDCPKLDGNQNGVFQKDILVANYRSIFLGLEEYNKDYYRIPVILKEF